MKFETEVETVSDWQQGEPLPEAFKEIPYLVYQQDPLWIPETAAELEAAFSQQNPYFEFYQAKAWAIPGKARLAGFYNPELRMHNEPVAYFGFWETIDDVEACRELFSRFEAWAIACGANRIYGPINFNTYNKYRIRLNLQPNEGCFLGEPYNPPYYQSLLESCGYHLDTVYISQYIPDSEVDQVYLGKERLMKEIDKLPFQFQYLSAEFWLERLPDFYQAIDIIFGNNFAYTPLTWEQFQKMYGPDFAKKLCPKLSVVVLDQEDQILGFSLGFPDYAPLCTQGANPRFSPAEISYQEHFKLLKSPTFLLRTIGVMPTFRKQDIMNAMGIYSMFNFKDYYKRGMACLMKTENFSTYFFRDFNHIRREYGLFSKVLE